MHAASVVRRVVAASAFTVALICGPITAAGAEPSTDTVGCQTVASKFLEEDAPGHEGIENAAGQAGGEGPCGFGTPPGHE